MQNAGTGNEWAILLEGVQAGKTIAHEVSVMNEVKHKQQRSKSNKAEPTGRTGHGWTYFLRVSRQVRR